MLKWKLTAIHDFIQLVKSNCNISHTSYRWKNGMKVSNKLKRKCNHLSMFHRIQHTDTKFVLNGSRSQQLTNVNVTNVPHLCIVYSHFSKFIRLMNNDRKHQRWLIGSNRVKRWFLRRSVSAQLIELRVFSIKSWRRVRNAWKSVI